MTDSLWRKRQDNEYDEDDLFEEHQQDDEDSEWTCDMCGGPMYRQAHWSYAQCGDCGARQELEDDI
jgi:rubrerythrin